MRFLITPDSYKESLSATEASEIIRRAITNVLPDAQCDLAPMADGGEGTAECLMAAEHGECIKCKVKGPLHELIDADYVWIESGKKAIIEVAKACGMMLVSPDKKEPLEASSYGVGQLIKHAIEKGCEQLVLTLGGTITNDGGIGMLLALGALISDSQGNPVSFGGKGLEEIATIDLREPRRLLAGVKVTILCDVKCPLLGSNGATYMFGPQKGAVGEVMMRLERGMENYARVLGKTVGRDIAAEPGSGAAGGLGCALFAISNAQYVNGAGYVMETLHLEERIRQCDFVITGEGSIDAQSLEGKVPVGIAQIASRYHKPVIAFVGMSKGDNIKYYEKGITAIFCILRNAGPIEPILTQAENNLTHAVENFARVLASRN